MAITMQGTLTPSPVSTVVFMLKDEKGNAVKTYNVPIAEVPTFETAIQETVKELEKTMRCALSMVKIQKVF